MEFWMSLEASWFWCIIVTLKNVETEFNLFEPWWLLSYRVGRSLVNSSTTASVWIFCWFPENCISLYFCLSSGKQNHLCLSDVRVSMCKISGLSDSSKDTQSCFHTLHGSLKWWIVQMVYAIIYIYITKLGSLLLILEIQNWCWSMKFFQGDIRAFRETSICVASYDISLDEMKATYTEHREKKVLQESQRGHMKIDLEMILEKVNY